MEKVGSLKNNLIQNCLKSFVPSLRRSALYVVNRKNLHLLPINIETSCFSLNILRVTVQVGA